MRALFGELSQLTARQAFEGWIEFASQRFRVPRHEEADGLLYQFGVYSLSGEPRFHLDLVRQFAQARGDEYLQLHLDVQYPADEAFSALGRHDEWHFMEPTSDLTAWARSLASRPEWGLLNDRRPVAVEIYLDET